LADHTQLGRLRSFYHSDPWKYAIDAAALANAAVLGVLTGERAGAPFSAPWHAADRVLLYFLCVDVGLSFVCGRRGKWYRWLDGWGWFNAAVTLVSFVPVAIGFAALRVLRVLRVLRLLSSFDLAREAIEALLHAAASMAAAFGVLLLTFYSFAVIATNLFAGIDPAHFATLGRSAEFLYAIMTSLGSDLQAVRPVVEKAPWAWPFFIVFVLTTSFGLMNLFLALLVSALRERMDKTRTEATDARLARIEAKLDALRTGD
jgi:voltage-gated sodium channel